MNNHQNQPTNQPDIIYKSEPELLLDPWYENLPDVKRVGKVCLIISFYLTPRLSDQDEGKCHYLEAQLHNLKKYKHNLDKIIFVFAEDGREKTEIKEKDDITYIYRKNFGTGFGGWIEASMIYRNSYDYYIFVEDDFCFVKDNFDQILIQEYKKLSPPEQWSRYIVTWKGSNSISTIGIVSSAHLKARHYLQHLLFHPDPNISLFQNKEDERLMKANNMGRFFLNIGEQVGISESYSVFPYWNGAARVNAKDFQQSTTTITLYGYKKGESKNETFNRMIMCPYQMLNKNFDPDYNNKFYYGSEVIKW